MNGPNRAHRAQRAAILPVLLVLVAGTAIAWPAFGPWIDTPGNSSGWRTESDGALVTVVAARGGSGEPDRRSIVMVRATGPSQISVHPLLSWTDAPDISVQRADVEPAQGGHLVALSLLSQTGPDADASPGRTIRLYRFGDEVLSPRPTGSTTRFGAPDAVIDLGASGPEMSWRLSAGEDGVELYWSRPDGHGGYELLRRGISDTLNIGEAERLFATPNPIVELQIIHPDAAHNEATNRVRSNRALVWIEATGLERTLASATIAGGRITIGPRVSVGQATLYSAGLRVPDSLIGPGIRAGLRPSFGGAMVDDRLFVAAAHIERSQSALSVFWTGLALHELRFDGSPPITRWIVEPGPTALFSFPTVALDSGATTVLFLHDRVDLGRGSDVYLWHGDDSRARNVSTSPRRVVAPGMSRRDGEAMMTWFLAQQDGFAPSVRAEVGSALRDRLPVPVEGDSVETVVSALLAVPVASAVALYYALIATAPALISVLLLITAFHRYRPDAMRRFGSVIVALMYAYCVAVFGRSPWSFAPMPTTVVPVIGVAAIALVGLIGWYRRAERRSLPTPAECTGAIAIALVAPAASTAFSLVMTTFANTGSMPLILGG